MTGHLALRAATQDDHAVVDGLFSRFDLASRKGYAGFLRAQAAALLPIERALDAAEAEKAVPDWPARRRGALLIADLAELGEDADDAVDALPLPSPAAIVGAVYVLEGSRLGGKLLRQRLPEAHPAAFLTAPAAPGAWRGFLDGLVEPLSAEDDLAQAVDAARTVFRRFVAAARRELGDRGDG